MARIREAQGDLDEALDLLDQAERLYNDSFSPNVRPLAARKARLWIIQGRLGDAFEWARRRALSVDDDLSYLSEFEHLTLARLLLARYHNERSERALLELTGFLERLLQAAQAGGRTGSVIDIRLLQALAAHAQDRLPAALEALRQALALAEPEGYLRTFLDEGPAMLHLLREAARRDILPAYTNQLLATFEAGQPDGTGKSPLPPTQPLIAPVSPRELEILHLIAQGLSNRDIGQRLFLALDTVKGHNRKIFDKLQAQSRTEAVARARQLGLL
jgi:LuxR family maltose regulon positive regulatory protein